MIKKERKRHNYAFTIVTYLASLDKKMGAFKNCRAGSSSLVLKHPSIEWRKHYTLMLLKPCIS